MASKSIFSLTAHELLDSRGNPTIYCRVSTRDGNTGEAVVPSGASTGTHEAHELRDRHDARYNGAGVLHAIRLIKNDIEPRLRGLSILNQRACDDALRELDGTKNKSRLGANTTLAVSLAIARCAARYLHTPLYRYLRRKYWPTLSDWILPVPMCNILNGGKHGHGSIDMQEFMIVPHGATSFSESIRWASEIHHALGDLLKEHDMHSGVGDEGGYMPQLTSHRAALDLLMESIRHAGYLPYTHVSIALDPAATEFYQDGMYHLTHEQETLSSHDMIALYAAWVQNYPIVSIEDGLAEDDWEGFRMLMKRIGDRTQIVGDDLFTTNIARITKGVEEHSANAVLIKPNQIGTLTETANAISYTHAHNMRATISHRSGETADAFIADLALACNAGQIKAGAPQRSERLAKYNRLLIIEHTLNSHARFAHPFTERVV